MIIDSTYFTEKLSLPQRGNTEGAEIIEGFIDTYETEYLKKALGYDLWKAFTDGIEGSGVPDQRWVDLLDGKEFTYLNNNNKWEGFQTLKKTPIANYVFYQYMGTPLNSLLSTVVQNVDNNSKISPTPLMIQVWNSMVDMNKVLWQFLKANTATYPEWVEINWSWDWWNETDSSWNTSEIFKKKNSFDL